MMTSPRSVPQIMMVRPSLHSPLAQQVTAPDASHTFIGPSLELGTPDDCSSTARTVTSPLSAPHTTHGMPSQTIEQHRIALWSSNKHRERSSSVVAHTRAEPSSEEEIRTFPFAQRR